MKPNLFRVPPSVVIGTKAGKAHALPAEAEHWSGRLPGRNISWALAAEKLVQTPAGVEVARDAPNSLYHSRFTQGATFVPRMLHTVEEANRPSPIGVAEVVSPSAAREQPTRRDRGRTCHRWRERSKRSSLGRCHPWARPSFPSRPLQPWLAIVTWDGSQLLDGSDSRLDLSTPVLPDWWRRAEAIWETNNGRPVR